MLTFANGTGSVWDVLSQPHLVDSEDKAVRILSSLSWFQSGFDPDIEKLMGVDV